MIPAGNVHGSPSGVLGLHCWDAEEFGKDEVGQNPHHSENVRYARRREQGVLTGRECPATFSMFALVSSKLLISQP